MEPSLRVTFMKQRLQFISEGGSVVRYHTRPGIKPDTDAHHSHGVAMLCYLLTEGTPSTNLLMAALTHDLAEQAASDVSAPAKIALGIREQLHEYEADQLCSFGFEFESKLTQGEAVVLKLADTFDGMLSCLRELALGNRNMMLVWRRWKSYIQALKPLPEPASMVYAGLLEIHKELYSETGPDFDVFR